MPQIDMPLEELKTYQGTNPCPADIDPYWERALSEMRSVDPKVELKPHSFNAPFAECFDMYFTGVRGARVHAQYLRPKGIKGRNPAVLLFHGYSGDAGDWSGKLGYVARGFCVAALDCRGQGGQSEDVGGVKGNTLEGHIIRGLDGAPEDLLFRAIFLDTAEMARIVMDMPEVDPDRVGCTGGSQGGGLTLACAALEPRIRKAFPIFPFLCDYQRAWEMDKIKTAYDELAFYFRRFDPLHNREKEIFTRLGYIDNQHLAKRIKAETIMAVGLMDETCPASTQFAAYNKMRCKKSMLVYPDFGHENLPMSGDYVYEFLSNL
jgi:cephalosporin-C deacetylase